MLPIRTLALLIVFGGFGGIVCDQIHVQFGVLAYRVPAIGGQAWWVGPLFAGATPVIVLSAAPFAKRLEDTPKSLAEFLPGTLWFLGAYFASGVFQQFPWYLTVGYVTTWGLRMALTRERGLFAAHSVALALGGMAFEGALSSTGAFYYTNPQFLYVPIWLGGLYMHGAPLALLVTKRLSVRS